MKQQKWLESVVNAFQNLEGEALLEDLYNETKRIRESQNIKLPTNWKAAIRDVIEEHSSDSDNFKSTDLFYKIGVGYWGLRNYQNNESEDILNLDTELFIDGITKERLISLSVRNQKLIIKRKILDNFTCQACGFHYDNKIVECHHLVPLSETKTTYNSVNDLITLCPNCHALAHSIYHLDEKYHKKEGLLVKLMAIIKNINR